MQFFGGIRGIISCSMTPLSPYVKSTPYQSIQAHSYAFPMDSRTTTRNFKTDSFQKKILSNMPENPRLLSLGMNGILSKRSQVEPGEAEQIPT
jgi:hypothetical protein